MMKSTNSTLTLTKDLLHQQHHLKEAVSIAMKEDCDLFIVSRDKKIFPCQRSLLVLYSPLIAHILSDLPCCLSPTIFLPHFQEKYIKKFLHLLGSGQSIHDQNINADIKIIANIAQVLQISMTDINIGTYVDNPLGVPFQIKKELNKFIVKVEIKQEVEDLNVKQETESLGENNDEMEYVEEDEIEIKCSDSNIKREKVSTMELNPEETGAIIEKKEKQEQTDGEEQSILSDSQCGSILFTPTQLSRLGESDLIQWYEDCGKFMELSGSASKDEAGLKDPMKIHTEGNSFVCSYCQKVFKTPSYLKTHTMIHTGGNPFPCKFCPKKFTSSSKLKMHTRIHYGDDSNDEGGLKDDMKTPTDLKRHTLIHTGEKPFPCQFCPRKFTRSSDVKKHTMIHTRDKPFLCDFCPKKFRSSQNLKIHIRIHKIQIRIHKLTTSTYLKRPTRICTGEKPFQCTVCNKKLVSNETLKEHKKKCNVKH